MLINVICSYQTIITMWGLLKKIVTTPGVDRFYFIGKFAGTLIDFLASIASFKEKQSTPNSINGAKDEIKASLAKQPQAEGTKDFISSLDEWSEKTENWAEQAEKAAKRVDNIKKSIDTELGLTKRENKDNS